MAEVASFADEHIITAAQSRWPGAALEFGSQVPSVAGYVRRMTIGGEVAYAKTSLVGFPLADVLRGTVGTWQEVRAAHSAYIRTAGGLVERQAAQLAVMERGRRPVVAPMLAYGGGVQFTQAVAGLSLSEMLLELPQESGVLLAGVMERLEGLRNRATARLVIGASDSRGVHANFQALFAGGSSEAYLKSVGRADPEAADVLRKIVRRLGAGDRLAGAGHPATAVVYGGLTPEHVIYPDSLHGEPVFLAPALTRDSPLADPAKLISRCVLMLLATRPGRAVAGQVRDGICAFAHQQAARFAGAREAALLLLLRLWAMDTAGLMSAYLSAPPDLPLPDHAVALRGRAAAVLNLVHQVAAAVANRQPALPALHRVLGDVVEAAS
nr:hypothetical protein OH826_19330 [Streptomyces sp. NBC_00899]